MDENSGCLCKVPANAIEKLFSRNTLKPRELELINDLVKTRVLYDEIRDQILTKNNPDSLTHRRSIDYETFKVRSDALMKIVHLIDRGEFPPLKSHISLHDACCQCCLCKSKIQIPKSMRAPMHPGNINQLSSYNDKIDKKRKKIKAGSEQVLSKVRKASADLRRPYSSDNLKKNKAVAHKSKKKKFKAQTEEPGELPRCFCILSLRKSPDRSIASSSRSTMTNQSKQKEKKDQSVKPKKNDKKQKKKSPSRKKPHSCVSCLCIPGGNNMLMEKTIEDRKIEIEPTDITPGIILTSTMETIKPIGHGSSPKGEFEEDLPFKTKATGTKRRRYSRSFQSSAKPGKMTNRGSQSKMGTSRKSEYKVKGPHSRKTMTKPLKTDDLNINNHSLTQTDQYDMNRSQGTSTPHTLSPFECECDKNRAQGTSTPHTLLPYECEPGTCTPGKCDPLACQKKIQARLNMPKSTNANLTKKQKDMGMNAKPNGKHQTSQSFGTSKKTRGQNRDFNNQKSKTQQTRPSAIHEAVMHQTSPSQTDRMELGSQTNILNRDDKRSQAQSRSKPIKGTNTKFLLKKDRGISLSKKDKGMPRSISSSSQGTGPVRRERRAESPDEYCKKQAVTICSSFSFNIEFSKKASLPPREQD